DHGQTPKGKDAALVRRKVRGVTFHAQTIPAWSNPGSALSARRPPRLRGRKKRGTRAIPWPRAETGADFLLTRGNSLQPGCSASEIRDGSSRLRRRPRMSLRSSRATGPRLRGGERSVLRRFWQNETTRGGVCLPPAQGARLTLFAETKPPQRK